MADVVRRRLLGTLLGLSCAWLPVWAKAGPQGAALRQDFALLLKQLGLSGAAVARLAPRLWKLHVEEEPWGSHHLSLLLRAWPPGRRAIPDASGLDPGVRWYLGHLMTTLVTGIYYHERGSEAVTWEDALMHVWLADIRPVPGQCGASFGAWARPPKGYDDRG